MKSLKLISIFFSSIYFFHTIAFANCELSWVSETEKDQNWIHTVATYSSEPTFIFLVPSLNKNQKMELSCLPLNQSFCENLKQMTVGTKSCALAKTKKEIKVPQEEEGPSDKLPSWLTDSCLPLPSANPVATVDANGVMKFPDSYPLTSQEQKTIEPAFEKTIRSLPELKAIELSTYPEIKADLSQKAIQKITLYSNPKFKDSAFAEIKMKIKIKEIASVCAKGCKDPNFEIEFPILLLKIANQWRLFGNGMIGQCSAYTGTSEPSLEEKLRKSFGLPVRYVFYDRNQDGTPDTLQLSSRAHLPGTVTLYELKTDGSVEVGTEVCIKSIGACFPEPGC